MMHLSETIVCQHNDLVTMMQELLSLVRSHEENLNLKLRALAGQQWKTLQQQVPSDLKSVSKSDLMKLSHHILTNGLVECPPVSTSLFLLETTSILHPKQNHIHHPASLLIHTSCLSTILLLSSLLLSESRMLSGRNNRWWHGLIYNMIIESELFLL